MANLLGGTRVTPKDPRQRPAEGDNQPGNIDPQGLTRWSPASKLAIVIREIFRGRGGQMPAITKVVLLSGQTTSFRTSVANALSNILAERQYKHAILNADELRQKWPTDNEYRFALYNGLSHVWPAFRAKVCYRLLLFGETVVAEAQELDGILEMAYVDDLTEADVSFDAGLEFLGQREWGDVEIKGFTLDCMRLTAIKEKPSSAALSTQSGSGDGGGLDSGASEVQPRALSYENGSDTLATEILQMFDRIEEGANQRPPSMEQTAVPSPLSPIRLRPFSTDQYRLEALPMIVTEGKDINTVAMEIFDSIREWIQEVE